MSRRSLRSLRSSAPHGWFSNRLRSSRPIMSAEQPLATMGEQGFPPVVGRSVSLEARPGNSSGLECSAIVARPNRHPRFRKREGHESSVASPGDVGGWALPRSSKREHAHAWPWCRRLRSGLRTQRCGAHRCRTPRVAEYDCPQKMDGQWRRLLGSRHAVRLDYGDSVRRIDQF